MGFASFFKRNKKEDKQQSSELEKEQLQLKKLNKKKEVPISKKSVVPSGCKKHLGYLHDRKKKSSKIPEECIVCLEVLNCLIQ